MLLRIIVFAAVGLIDRIDSFFLGGNLVAPFADIFRKVFRTRRFAGPAPGRVILVRVHAAARRVNDRGAGFPRLDQNLVHARCHFRASARRVQTMVQIPHVANNHGRLGGIPLLLLGQRLKSRRAGLRSGAGPQLELKLLVRRVAGGIVGRGAAQQYEKRAGEQHAERSTRQAIGTSVECHNVIP